MNSKDKCYSTNSYIKSDIYRYIGNSKYTIIKILKTLYEEEALIYLICYRIEHRINQMKISFLKFIYKILFSYTIYKIISIVLGIKIDDKADIGKGFYIGHYGQIFIGKVIIGDNCNISQGVTIGYGGVDTLFQGLPEIGNNVFIGPGAKIFGGIKIGNNVCIGANTVVTKTIKNNSIVLGNPGRIIGHQEVNKQIQNKWE